MLMMKLSKLILLFANVLAAEGLIRFVDTIQNWKSLRCSGIEPKLEAQIELKRFLVDLRTDDEIKATLLSLSKSAAKISQIISTAPIFGLTGKSNSKNSFDEEQKKLDIITNNLIREDLSATSCVKYIATEEDIGITDLNPVLKEGIIITYDPLDGSSNIDCNIPTGTIFGISKTKDTISDPLSQILQGGSAIRAAGYCLYSSSTEFIFSVGNGTFGFTYHPLKNKFFLTKDKIKCPPRGPYYSLNEGRSSDWPLGLQRYIFDIKNGKSAWGKQYSSRYVCSLVADVHRTLLYGGWAGNPRSHLRYLYEAAPLAFIAEQCGGSASDGKRRILDIIPVHLHYRLPVFIGSREDIAELEGYGDVQQLGSKKYEA